MDVDGIRLEDRGDFGEEDVECFRQPDGLQRCLEYVVQRGELLAVPFGGLRGVDLIGYVPANTQQTDDLTGYIRQGADMVANVRHPPTLSHDSIDQVDTFAERHLLPETGESHFLIVRVDER